MKGYERDERRWWINHLSRKSFSQNLMENKTNLLVCDTIKKLNGIK